MWHYHSVWHSWIYAELEIGGTAGYMVILGGTAGYMIGTAGYMVGGTAGYMFGTARYMVLSIWDYFGFRIGIGSRGTGLGTRA